MTAKVAFDSFLRARYADDEQRVADKKLTSKGHNTTRGRINEMIRLLKLPGGLIAAANANHSAGEAAVHERCLAKPLHDPLLRHAGARQGKRGPGERDGAPGGIGFRDD
jgi:hypothetical protein